MSGWTCVSLNAIKSLTHVCLRTHRGRRSTKVINRHGCVFKTVFSVPKLNHTTVYNLTRVLQEWIKFRPVYKFPIFEMSHRDTRFRAPQENKMVGQPMSIPGKLENIYRTHWMLATLGFVLTKTWTFLVSLSKDLAILVKERTILTGKLYTNEVSTHIERKKVWHKCA